MMKANYEEVRWHLGYVLGIHLDQHLRIRRPGTLKHYSVIAALIVAYRYAEALGQKLVIHDMTTGGHKSHQVGTELDFDLDANTLFQTCALPISQRAKLSSDGRYR